MSSVSVSSFRLSHGSISDAACWCMACATKHVNAISDQQLTAVWYSSEHILERAISTVAQLLRCSLRNHNASPAAQMAWADTVGYHRELGPIVIRHDASLAAGFLGSNALPRFCALWVRT